MNIKIVTGIVVLLGVISGGYFYLANLGKEADMNSDSNNTGEEMSQKNTQTTDIQSAIASVLEAAEQEATIIESDEGDLTLVEEHNKNLSNESKMYDANEF